MEGNKMEGGGYRGFGSFHSDNVEELIRQDDDSYAPPALPVAWSDLLPPSSQQQQDEDDVLPSFGHALRDAHFLLDSEWTFINHGAFGTSPPPLYLDPARVLL
jgi:hypothetical protein